MIGVAYEAFSTKARARQREAQMSPVAATESDSKASLPFQKAKALWFNVRDQRAFTAV
jgi:hypothetical protein